MQLIVCRKRQKKLMKAAKGKAVLPSKGVDLPVNGVYPFSCLGVTSEAFGDALGDYVRANPDSSLQGQHLMHHDFMREGFVPRCQAPVFCQGVACYKTLLDTNHTRLKKSLAHACRYVSLLGMRSIHKVQWLVWLHTLRVCSKTSVVCSESQEEEEKVRWVQPRVRNPTGPNLGSRFPTADGAEVHEESGSTW